MSKLQKGDRVEYIGLYEWHKSSFLKYIKNNGVLYFDCYVIRDEMMDDEIRICCNYTDNNIIHIEYFYEDEIRKYKKLLEDD